MRPTASRAASVAPTIRRRRGLRVPAGRPVRVGAARGAARIDGSPERVPGAAVRPRDRPATTTTLTTTRSNRPVPTLTPTPLVHSPRGRPGPARARRFLGASHGGTRVPRPIVDSPLKTSAPKRVKKPGSSSRRRTKSCGPRSATRDPHRRWRHRARRQQGRVSGARRPVRRGRMTLMRHHRARRSAGAEAGGIVRARGRAAELHRRPVVPTRPRVARTTDRARRIGS